MRLRSLLPFVALLALACGKDKHVENPPPPDAGLPDAGMFVVEIDIDDHGLKALWDADAPNLKRMIREGTLAYTRVIVPTHSNESNMTLVTGDYPDGHNVPTNSWLDRQNGYRQDFSIGSLGTGDYIYFDHNPLNPAVAHHVESVWSATNALGAGKGVYVGQLPPWELGANEVHFTLKNATLFGIPLDAKTITSLLEDTLRYPKEYVQNTVKLDGPPDAGETIEHFTIRDAADVWRQAAAGGAPPRYMFVWAFIALDGDPTSEYGGEGPQLAKIVSDYDDAIGALLDAIDSSPYAGHVNILFTLDHGKVNTTSQAVLGETGNDGQQLSQLVSGHGAPQVSGLDYDLLNEDGDALIYAKAPDAGSAAGYPRQEEIAHKLVDLIQAGTLPGVDVTRTITWDGYRGTRRMHDYRIESPNSADIIVFPKDGWTLNDVDGTGVPGPFDTTKHPYPYGRHGGFSEDELYVPLIMWGPAFKKGAILPHPVNHADVAPTAMAILGQPIGGAEGAPITAAFEGDPAESFADPADMTTARDTALSLSGFHGATQLAATPAPQVVVIAMDGVSYDEVFKSGNGAYGSVSGLASTGVSFEAAWNRYRFNDENKYELLAGGLPVVGSDGGWLPTVESDPGQTGAPGQGLLLEPAQLVANPAALTAWRGNDVWATESLLGVADAQGWATAVFSTDGRGAAHIQLPANTVNQTVTFAGAADAVQTFFGAHPHALAFVSLAGNPGSSSVDAAVGAIASTNPNAMVVVTSMGGVDLSAPGLALAGAEQGRHVPLVIARGPARVGVVSGQPATAADLPATVLFAMGLPATTDFVEGTWIAGPANADGVPQPVPSTATAGHVLAAAFSVH